MTDAEKLPYHVPVLLKESVDGLNIHEGGIYVDVTFGGGGHSREILSRLNGTGHLYSFDQDADAAKRVFGGSALGDSNGEPDNFTFVLSNFRYLKNWMRYYGVDHIDGLLADLGVSSHQFDVGGRGFSFRFDDAPLDMRMNSSAGKTAADVLNSYDEERLANVFYLYGELRNSRRLASAIVKARQKKALATALREMLLAATELLAADGRLSVITYHSLEDRIVKNVIRSGNTEGKISQDLYGRVDTPFRAVNNKVITPDADEQERNPRSRSAKLRIAVKI